MRDDIIVCSCGKIIYKGKIVGNIDLNPKWFSEKNNGIVPMTFIDDSCINYTDD